jgi:hypothetical protein
MTVEIKSGCIRRRFQSIEWGCLLDVRHAPMAIEFALQNNFRNVPIADLRRAERLEIDGSCCNLGRVRILRREMT